MFDKNNDPLSLLGAFYYAFAWNYGQKLEALSNWGLFFAVFKQEAQAWRELIMEGDICRASPSVQGVWAHRWGEYPWQLLQGTMYIGVRGDFHPQSCSTLVLRWVSRVHQPEDVHCMHLDCGPEATRWQCFNGQRMARVCQSTWLEGRIPPDLQEAWHQIIAGAHIWLQLLWEGYMVFRLSPIAGATISITAVLSCLTNVL